MKYTIFLILSFSILINDVELIGNYQNNSPEGWEPYIAGNKIFILSEGGSCTIEDIGGLWEMWSPFK